MQDQRRKWLRALRLTLTIVLSSVMGASLLFYALRGEGFPDSFWVTCGVVGAGLMLLMWWWDLERGRL